jgi:hypothetical protein
MPVITKSIEDLAPNIFNTNSPNSLSIWFSRIRTVYSKKRGGTILPPTKTEFINEWNYYYQGHEFFCQGETIQECKDILCANYFPDCSFTIMSQNRIKNIAWTRMIMTFNMYAAVCETFGIQCNKIDFIGSTAEQTNSLVHYFDSRNVLFIRDFLINRLIYDMLNRNENYTRHFWQLIFEIYDSIFSINDSISFNNLEREYFNRGDIDDTEICFDNKQIANMIMRTKKLLPKELRKNIFETCMAIHVSRSA